MVNPVPYGPIEKFDGPPGKRTYYSRQLGYKQTRPFTTVTSYERRLGSLMERYPDTFLEDAVTAAGWPIWEYFPSDAPMVSRAYEKLKGKLSDRASIGVTLAEGHTSLAMIATRLRQLGGFATALRRLQFGTAAKYLRMSFIPKGVSKKRSFANNYLEFHFGWAPLIGDIYNAVNVLQSPFKTLKLKAGSQGPVEKCDLTIPIHDDNPDRPYPGYCSQDVEKYWIGVRRVHMGVDVRIDNPNLWLATQLGLVNPAAIAIELVPFSFVADWFFNLNQFLGKGTDWLGLTLENGYTTRVFSGTYWHFDDVRYWWLEGSPPSRTYGGRQLRTRSIVKHMQRSIGITYPEFFVRPLKLWHWRRVAAAASLTVQQLGSRK